MRRTSLWSKPHNQRVAQSVIRAVAYPRDVPIRPDQNGSGGYYLADRRKLPVAGIFGVDRQDSVCTAGGVETPGLAKVQKDRVGVVEEGEYAHRSTGRDHVEIGHAASEQRMSLAQVVMDVQAGHHRGESFAWLVHAQQLGHGVAQCVDAIVDTHECDLRHRVAQYAGSDRVSLGVVGIEETLWRNPFDHLRQLPTQVHRILHTGVETLSTDRGMHVCRIAGQQDPSRTVGRGLPGHVGEPGDPGGTVDPVVGPVDGDEALAEIAQGGFARSSDVRFGHHDSYRSAFLVNDFAVADLVLHLALGMDARGIAAHAQFRLVDHLDLGEQAARRRIPTGEVDACCFTDHTASSVAPDEILRPQRRAVGQRNVDAGVVLREPGYLTSAIDRHRQLADPAGQDALDVVLPQPERVRVPGGKVADVKTGAAERRDLHHLSLREEPIGDSALVENLDGA